MVTFLHSCTECVSTDDACGWCNYNKLCSGTADGCTDSNETYWLRVSETGFLEHYIAFPERVLCTHTQCIPGLTICGLRHDPSVLADRFLLSKLSLHISA